MNEVVTGCLKASYTSELTRVHEMTVRISGHKNTADHMWIDGIKDQGFYNDCDTLRSCPEIMTTLKNAFPGYQIFQLACIDEVYYSYSPNAASYSDRSLVDCHYDSLLGFLMPKDSMTIRVILSCSDNGSVHTTFPNTNKDVVLSFGDYVTMDYNRTYHCVHGEVPSGSHRVLLKLHFQVTKCPDCMYSKMVVSFNILWTKLSRYLMRISARPRNGLETFVAFLVNTFRILYNHGTMLCCTLITLLLLYGIWRLIPRVRSLRGKEAPFSLWNRPFGRDAYGI